MSLWTTQHRLSWGVGFGGFGGCVLWGVGGGRSVVYLGFTVVVVVVVLAEGVGGFGGRVGGPGFRDVVSGWKVDGFGFTVVVVVVVGGFGGRVGGAVLGAAVVWWMVVNFGFTVVVVVVVVVLVDDVGGFGGRVGGTVLTGAVVGWMVVGLGFTVVVVVVVGGFGGRVGGTVLTGAVVGWEVEGLGFTVVVVVVVLVVVVDCLCCSVVIGLAGVVSGGGVGEMVVRSLRHLRVVEPCSNCVEVLLVLPAYWN